MSADTPVSQTPVNPKKPARENALQDTKQANEIAAAERLLTTIQTQPALKDALTKLGYDEAEIGTGTALQAGALAKYTLRQTELAIASQNMEARDTIAKAAEDEFSSYRQTVQALYKGPERATLGASGQIPDDIEVFATTARTAYTAAQKEPYASKLATRGFSPARSAAAFIALTAYSNADAAGKASQKTAVAATTARNTAVKAVNDWVAELRKVAKANLKKTPELLALMQE